MSAVIMAQGRIHDETNAFLAETVSRQDVFTRWISLYVYKLDMRVIVVRNGFLDTVIKRVGHVVEVSSDFLSQQGVAAE